MAVFSRLILKKVKYNFNNRTQPCNQFNKTYYFILRNNIKKYGAPIIAMMTPTGISSGG